MLKKLLAGPVCLSGFLNAESDRMVLEHSTVQISANISNHSPAGWVRVLAKLMSNFNPLWGLRAVGPAGPWLVSRTRPDIMRKYEELLGAENTRLVSNYIFHCNGHNPTGEAAFHSLMSGFGWARHPMLPRLDKLEESGKFIKI